MTEIDNLTSWPQRMSPRAKDDAEICHRPESCRFMGCLCIYSQFFAEERHKMEMSNILCLTWPVMSQVTLGSNFSTSSQRSHAGLSSSVWIFPPRLLVTEIVLGATTPPAGRVTHHTSRARVKHCAVEINLAFEGQNWCNDFKFYNLIGKYLIFNINYLDHQVTLTWGEILTENSRPSQNDQINIQTLTK